MTTIAVVGLGYVGLPLAVEFGKKHPTIGFDLSAQKVAAYRQHVDPTGEVSTDELPRGVAAPGHDRSRKRCAKPTSSSSPSRRRSTTPTSPTSARCSARPSRSAGTSSAARRSSSSPPSIPARPRRSASRCSSAIRGSTWKRDFFVGYSPERINPGDKEHTLTRITKVVSGDTPETLERVAAVYGSVVTAGVHRASSIKVAEAAKVIENTQRDLNIALMNELALIFHRVGIDTLEVLQAAGTKWNFLPFRPGLVGGHCIGVDPYYLTHKAEMLGYFPQVILAGRRINDGMGKYIAEQTVKQLIQHGSPVKGADVIVLGLTFKEDVPDLRNSRVIDVVRELESYGARVHVHDPVAQAGGGRARVRRQARRLGSAPSSRRDRRRGGAPRVQGAPGRRLRREARPGRPLRRREIPDGRRRARRARRPRLAALIGPTLR